MKIDDLFTHGFVVFNEPNLHERNDFCKYLAEKYLEPIFPSWKLIECHYSEKISSGDRITVWHNDSNFGMNITFLYYMDDMNSDIGGAISIRNGLYEEKIYPKSGMVILLSQQLHV